MNKCTSRWHDDGRPNTDMMETEESSDMDNQMADMMPEEKTEEQKAIEKAQAPDEEMEENYVDFLIDEALDDEEEEMLMEELQANPKLSMLFDKVMEVAMEFSGSGPVEGPLRSLRFDTCKVIGWRICLYCKVSRCFRSRQFNVTNETS